MPIGDMIIQNDDVNNENLLYFPTGWFHLIHQIPFYCSDKISDS